MIANGTLSTYIPQRGGEAVAWSRFLGKAAKGSHKAAEMLTRAKIAAVRRK